MKHASWHMDNPLNCPLVHAMGIIGGKWKPIIIHILNNGTHRFGEIKKCIPQISQKVLTQQLRELELDGVVHRSLYPQVPPRVEYKLTNTGLALQPIIESLYQWGALAKCSGTAGEKTAKQ